MPNPPPPQKSATSCTPTPHFSIRHYKHSQNPQTYLLDLLTSSPSYKNMINAQQLQQLLKSIGLILNKKQLQQLYLYATYPFSQVSTFCQQGSRVDVVAVGRWLRRKINKGVGLGLEGDGDIKYQKRKINTLTTQINLQSDLKLPNIKLKSQRVVSNELSRVLGIFSQMEKERQSVGLEPMSISSDEEEEEHGQPVRQIHYDGSFFEVNRKLFKMRNQAKQGIERIIEATKNDTQLKKKFEEALMRYERVRTQGNEKVGRQGAMKAQKRMIDRQKQEILELQRWRQRTNQTQFHSKYY